MRGRVICLFMVLFGAAPLAGQGGPEPAEVSAEEFAGLSWLEGRWLGSGGGYDAFYEAYRFVDPGTIEQTTYPDETFAEADGRSTMELRDGHVGKFRNGVRESFLARLAGDTLRFERPSGRPGFTWIRITDDEWHAILDRPGGAEPVVYVLRRVEGDGAEM